MQHRKYPVKRQKEDARDIKFAVAEAAELPSAVDLRENCPPVFDQGEIGSCTANAGVAAYMMLKDTDAELSRLFLYYQERVIEGTTGEDAGATMRSIGKALNKYGVCKETIWPYVEDKYNDDPPDRADIDAKRRKITAYKQLSGVTAIKQYIYDEKRPVMIGMEVYESFEADTVKETGLVPIPDTDDEELLGGHAVLIVGYDDNFGKTHKVGGIFSNLLKKLLSDDDDGNGYFIVRNSWGAEWGDEGYFYLPYAFVKKYAFDFWVLE